MTPLLHKKHHQNLTKAWKTKIREKHLTPKRNNRVWLWIKSIVSWAFLTGMALSILANLVFERDPFPEKKQATLVILLSCLGCVLAGWWHMRLFSPVDSYSLANTPVDNRTMRKHHFYHFLPVLLLALLVTIASSSFAAPIPNGHPISGWTWVLICEFILLISTSIFLILGCYLNFFMTSIAAIGVAVILGVTQFFLPSYAWHLQVLPVLNNLWPAAWPMDIQDHSLHTIQLLIILAIIGSAIHHVYFQFKSYQFTRSSFEYAVDDDTEAIEEMRDIYASTLPSLKDIDPKTFELPTITNPEPQKYSEVIEWVIWKISTPSQQHLLSISRTPNHTKSWLYSLAFLCVATALFVFVPDGFAYSKLTTIAATIFFATAAFQAAPLRSSTSLLTDPTPISAQSQAPLCTLLPIPSYDIIAIRWKEALVRTLFAAPILSYIVSLSHGETVAPHLLNSFIICLWALFHWRHLSISSSFSDQSNKHAFPSRTFFTSVLNIFLTLAYAASVVTSTISIYHTQNVGEVSTIGVISIVASLGCALIIHFFTMRLYRSPHSDYSTRLE